MPVRDEPHQIFVDAALRAEGVETLGYAAQDIEWTIKAIVAATPEPAISACRDPEVGDETGQGCGQPRPEAAR